jgi:GntR family transcriptional regulator/MocR family aminotransferase
MSLRRRLDLLEWARTNKCTIFEDDYDSEYRYCGRPVPALHGIDCGGQVVFAGSFSKVMFPSLRLGYMVLPEDLIDRIAAVKSITSSHASLLQQIPLCDFMTEGHYARHIRRMREVYSERQKVLLNEARKHLTGLLEISDIEAGLQTVGWLSNGLTAVAAAEAAAARGVEVVPLSSYTTTRRACVWSQGGNGREGLQLGFAAITPQMIKDGVKELAVALQGLTGDPRMKQ